MTLPKGYGGQQPTNRRGIQKFGIFLLIIGLIMSAMALVDTIFLDGEYGAYWLPTTFGITTFGLVLNWYGGRRTDKAIK